jgi:Fe-S-cluster containining protein
MHLLETEKDLRGNVAVVEHSATEEAPFRCRSLNAEENTCAIYTSRPFECRLYPFVLNRRDFRFFLSVDPQCPYIAEQENGKPFKAYAARLAAYLQTAEARAILRENINEIFQSYSGVRDLTELTL